ncbi:MAG: hypothetical protein ACXWUE_21685 [Polyangiales bacterium]
MAIPGDTRTMTSRTSRIALSTAVVCLGCAAAARPPECPPPREKIVVRTVSAPSASVSSTPPRYDVLAVPRSVRSFARRDSRSNQLFPQPGENWVVSVACNESEDGSAPPTCALVPLTAHEKTPEMQRVLQCYKPLAHAVTPAQWKLLVPAIARRGSISVTPDPEIVFGPDLVVVVVRSTVIAREPILGKKKYTGIDSGMTPPPIVGWKQVAHHSESWGWFAPSGTVWSSGGPFPHHERRLLALEPFAENSGSADPFRAASAATFDRVKLMSLYDSLGDPVLRFAAHVDLAVEHFAAGDGEAARVQAASARSTIAAARAVSSAAPLLERALAAIVERAGDYDTDPCAPGGPKNTPW